MYCRDESYTKQISEGHNLKFTALISDKALIDAFFFN